MEQFQILEIHLRKRGIDPQQYKPCWPALIKACNQFVGSELEEVVITARLNAFERTGKGNPSPDDLIAAMKATTPMAQLSQTDVEKIRTFCHQHNVRPVNYREAAAESGGRTLAI